jgi:hypothetical protein
MGRRLSEHPYPVDCRVGVCCDLGSFVSRGTVLLIEPALTMTIYD